MGDVAPPYPLQAPSVAETRMMNAFVRRSMAVCPGVWECDTKLCLLTADVLNKFRSHL